MNVIYLGMADDLFASLTLVPDLTVLYVIDKFDYHYGSWEEQKNDMKQLLLDGNTSNTRRYKDSLEEGLARVKIGYLKSKCIITSDTDDGTIWKLDFIYENISRSLIYFHHQDFTIKWPDMITDISHVMMIGSYTWDWFIKDKDKSALPLMLKTRTNDNFWIYAHYFCHKHFDIRILLKNTCVAGDIIASKFITKSQKQDIIETIIPDDYDPNYNYDKSSDDDSNDYLYDLDDDTD